MLAYITIFYHQIILFATSAPESHSREEKQVPVDSSSKETRMPGIPENWNSSEEKQ